MHTDLLKALVAQGAQLEDPFASPAPSSPAIPPITPLLKLTYGVLRLAWFLNRPLLVPLAVLFCARRWRNLWARSKVLSCVLVGVLAKLVVGLCRDPIIARAMYRGIPFKKSPQSTVAGLFWNEQSAKMKAILGRCDFAKGEPYRAPAFLWNGDISTLYYALCCRAPAISFQRTYLPFGSEFLALDWAFPKKVSRETPVMLILPGVGGDSNVPYLLQACDKALEKGWVCCVMLALGLGTSRVKDVRNLFEPSTLGDLQKTIDLISAVFNGPIFLLGFSLGGVTVCNYLSRCSSPSGEPDDTAEARDDALPIPSRRVTAAVAVSGAFRLDFMNWWRYKSVYQSVIVPALLLEVYQKYSDQLVKLLSPRALSTLFSSTSYSDLHSHLFSPLKQALQGEQKFDLANPMKSLPVEFDSWKASLEGDERRLNIKVPLLLLTALDDPFHEVDQVGVEVSPANPLLAYLVTESGGHVAWPRGLKDFSFAQSVATSFCDSVISEQ